MFWKKYPKYYGSGLVSDYFFDNNISGNILLKNYLENKPIELKESLKRIVPRNLWDIIGIDNWAWIEELIGDDKGVLYKAEIKLFSDIKDLESAEKEYINKKEYGKAEIIKKTINTLVKQNILSFLSRNNVIPKYGFPIDVVEMQIFHHGEEANGIELNRDLKIALSEYAPESQVVARGKLWTSNYIKKLHDREPIKYAYAFCDECGYYYSDLAEKQNNIEYCICGHKIRHKGEYITPEFGFISGGFKEPKLMKPEKTYTTRKYFAREGEINKEIIVDVSDFKIKLSAGDGKLAVINNAKGRGFKVCQKCGYSIINNGNPLTKHKNQFGKECNGKADIFSLGYEFKTDILKISIEGLRDNRRGFWYSLLYGILEGACSALDIERQDLDGTLFPYSGDPYSPAIVLFDDVPGGAAHVKRIAEEEVIIEVFRKTLEIVSKCECGGEEADSSCYGCLRNFSNQYCHDELKRKYVIEFLNKILN